MRNTLDNISPIDGRYHEATEDIAKFVSERAFMSYRVRVEIAWLEQLSMNQEIACPKIEPNAAKVLNRLKLGLSYSEAERIKAIESETRHDVKAVEYFIREQLLACGAAELATWIHFACTSEDINNTAYALMLKELNQQNLTVGLKDLCLAINDFAKKEKNTAMLSWTHGQTASPTTFGKELAVFNHRLLPKLQQIANYRFSAKINGAVGNFNAHIAAYPNVDWQQLASNTIKSLGLDYNPISTQISNHDNLIGFISLYRQAMLILHDLSQDLWLYTHKGYLTLKKDIKSQVGSSTMPHKINPIHFENAEGNIGLHKAIAGQLIDKLPISRLQRDLSDSTTLRNIGLCFAYATVALSSLQKGLRSAASNADLMHSELDNHWEVLTEAVQTILRKHGKISAYEDLKAASQGQSQSKDDFKKLLENLELENQAKLELEQLSPESYLGLAVAQTEQINTETLRIIDIILNTK